MAAPEALFYFARERAPPTSSNGQEAFVEWPLGALLAYPWEG
jgi:hypothetical protein